MAVVTRSIAAPPEQVFAILADGWLYAGWVVGTSRIRDVDEQWPAVGSKMHHSVGAWPLLLSDESEVLESVPGVRLVLATRGRPVGEAEVVIELAPAPGGTTLTMTERPTAGPGRWLHNPGSDAMLKRRNVESLQRLAWIVERRAGVPPV